MRSRAIATGSVGLLMVRLYPPRPDRVNAGASGRLLLAGLERIGPVGVRPVGAPQAAKLDEAPNRNRESHQPPSRNPATSDPVEHGRQQIENQKPPAALVAIVQPLDAHRDARHPGSNQQKKDDRDQDGP